VQSIRSNFGTELKIWERLRIIVGDGRAAGIYIARIEELINGGVVITEPEFVSGHTLLRNGVDVTVQITRQDAAYQFWSRIYTQTTGESKRVILAPPRRLVRVQRRMFARVDIPTRVTYAELPSNPDWNDWEQQVTWHQTRCVNVSGGGILLKLPEPFAKERIAVMRIDVFSEAELPGNLLAVCRRIFESEGENYGGFEFLVKGDLGYHFTKTDLARMPDSLSEFDQHAQDRLVTFLFHKQIELRQKGLL